MQSSTAVLKGDLCSAEQEINTQLTCSNALDHS